MIADKASLRCVRVAIVNGCPAPEWADVTSSKAARTHYLPASLIGGFGQPESGRRSGNLRYARVCVRRPDHPERTTVMRADQVAVQNGLYDVDQSGPELPADFAERLWKAYEGPLPVAIRALESGKYTKDDWLTVLLHVQAQSIRHPDFDREALNYLARQGARSPGGDQVQAQRQRTHVETRQLMAGARFAVVRYRHPAQHFLINDKGYVPLYDVIRNARGVVFPLSGQVGVLMVAEAAQAGDDYETAPVTERTLNPKAMAIINEATWDTVGIRCVIGHPDDTAWISDLQPGPKAVKMPQYGPYRWNREAGLFDWALRMSVRLRAATEPLQP